MPENIPLREWIEMLVQHERELAEERLRTIDAKLDKAEQVREQLRQESTNFIRRDVYDQLHEQLSRRVATLESARSYELGSRAVIGSIVVGIPVVISAAIALAVHFL